MGMSACQKCYKGIEFELELDRRDISTSKMSQNYENDAKYKRDSSSDSKRREINQPKNIQNKKSSYSNSGNEVHNRLT
ncbi:unnamed protein product [Blepharisma stoltei]|uniref:Uncharacterized protein n=1 Tax=Blepharisma stoltei TaxID=1481888 RepID=A0AAU9J3M3_9CILI|nr:unnamed protein product [Blepharisma stoltei]